MLTQFQKNIYNAHLYAFRLSKNEAFTPKKNFDDLSQDKINQIEILESIFKKYKHLNLKLYFNAPYKIYTDKNYYDLSYYTKPIALKTYHLYVTQLDHQDVDHNDQIGFIIDSLGFIKDYCIDNKIELDNYLTDTKSVSYSWCEHLLSNKISIYVLLGFSYRGFNIYSLFNSMPPDEVEMFLGKHFNEISTLKSNLSDSKKAKFLIIKGLQKINDDIHKSLVTNELQNSEIGK